MKRISATLAALVVFATVSSSTVAHTKEPFILSAVRALLIDVPEPTHEETSLAPADLPAEVRAYQALRIGCTVGLIDKQRGLWLTAAHCVDHALPMYVRIDSTTKQQAFAFLGDRENDLGLLHTGPVSGKLNALKLASKAPTWGDMLTIAGFPYGEGPFIVWGLLANPGYTFPATGGTYMMYSIAACPGNSGSPVLNSANELVSVHQIGIERGCAPLKGGATYAALKAFASSYFGG